MYVVSRGQVIRLTIFDLKRSQRCLFLLMQFFNLFSLNVNPVFISMPPLLPFPSSVVLLLAYIIKSPSTAVYIPALFSAIQVTDRRPSSHCGCYIQDSVVADVVVNKSSLAILSIGSASISSYGAGTYMDVDTLMEKIEEGDIEYVRNFIRSHPDRINQPHGWGQTPLMLACAKGNTSIIKMLIETGFDVNMGDNFYGWRALHFAVNMNQPEAVATLLKEATIQMNPQNNYGQTPLHLACLRGYKDIVDHFLNHIDIKPNVVDKNGDTPLHLAVRKQQYDMVILMLSQDSVKLEVKNYKKMTPLLEAVSRGYLGITHCLIARGANVNDVDGEGNSCLHLAVKTEVFNSEGAPMDILDECCTDLNLKTEERFSGVVVARYLASQGADFHHRNNKNNTPLDLIKDPNLRKRFETFLPPKCLWCRVKAATTKFRPCGHFVTCEKCSKISFKRCLKCGKPVTSTTKDESLNLGEEHFHNIAKKLGSKWQQVGRELGIKQVDLNIIKSDFPNDTVEQSFQMLHKWFQICDPAKRTLERLREALDETECFDALQCLSL